MGRYKAILLFIFFTSVTASVINGMSGEPEDLPFFPPMGQKRERAEAEEGLGLGSSQKRSRLELALPLPQSGQTERELNLLNLPEELLQKIVGEAELEDQLKLTLVCEKARRMAEKFTHKVMHLKADEIDKNNFRKAEFGGNYSQTKKLTILPKSGSLSPEKMALIAQYFPNLEGLSVSDTQLDDAGFKALLDSPLVTKLMELNISQNELSASNFTKENFDKLEQLKILKISGNGLGEQGVKALLTSTLAGRLNKLSMIDINWEPYVAKKKAPILITKEMFDKFTNLESLAIRGPDFSNSTLASLAQSDLAKILKELIIKERFIDDGSLDFNNFVKLEIFEVGYLTDNQFNLLAQSLLAKRLKELAFTLEDPDTTIPNRITIEKLNNFERLEKLFISNSGWEMPGVTIESFFGKIAQSKLAPHLKVLGLRNQVFDQDFTIQNLNKFSKLEELRIYSYIQHAPVGDKGFAAIAQSDISPQLRVLQIVGSEITDAVLTLRNFNRFKKLQKLNLRDNVMRPEHLIDVLAQSVVAPNLVSLDIRKNLKQGECLRGLNKFINLKTLYIDLKRDDPCNFDFDEEDEEE